VYSLCSLSHKKSVLSFGQVSEALGERVYFVHQEKKQILALKIKSILLHRKINKSGANRCKLSKKHLAINKEKNRKGR